MKNLFFAIALLLGITISAQQSTEKTNVFLRVYDLNSKLISKGKILSISETSLQLKGKKEQMEIVASRIGLIKTGRAVGHNVLMGAAIGATVGAIYGGATNVGSDAYFTTGEGAVLGVFLGGAAGVVTGAITTAFKKRSIFFIDGNELKWVEFRETITGLKQ